MTKAAECAEESARMNTDMVSNDPRSAAQRGKSDMKIATYETGFADMQRISKENPCNGIELFEDDGSEDGGKRWAILSNDLPEKAVREIVGILTNWVPLISLPQRPGTAGMAN